MAICEKLWVELRPEVFKLGGLVVEGSLKQGIGTQFSFEITDTLNVVSVTYVGIDLPPVLFEEGQGTIVTGQWIDGVPIQTFIVV